MNVNYFCLDCFPPGSECDLHSFSQTINTGGVIGQKRHFDLVESRALLLFQKVCVSEEMELLEDKVRLLKLQEEKAILMRKDVVIEEKLCDVKVCLALSL